MFNIGFILVVVSALSITGIIWYMISNRYLKKEVKELTSKLNYLEYKQVDFKYAAQAMVFLDNLIELKFSYYLYSDLMPIYAEKKIPEKSQVNEIKEKIYVSVVGGLTQAAKKSILSFFNEKGIEIYIHEKIINLMNRTDVTNTDRFKDLFKDAKGERLDTLMP